MLVEQECRNYQIEDCITEVLISSTMMSESHKTASMDSGLTNTYFSLSGLGSFGGSSNWWVCRLATLRCIKIFLAMSPSCMVGNGGTFSGTTIGLVLHVIMDLLDHHRTYLISVFFKMIGAVT